MKTTTCRCCGKDKDDRFCRCTRLWCKCGKCTYHCCCAVPKLVDQPQGGKR